MDRNFFLAFALSFAVLTLWMAWEAERREDIPLGEEAPVIAEEAVAPAPAPAPRAQPAERSGGPTSTPVEARPTVPEQRFRFDSPLYDAVFTSRGAGLDHWELKKYRASAVDGGAPVVLTTGEPPYRVAMVTAFPELGLGDLSDADYVVEEEGPHGITFRLEREGIVVRKSYRLDEDSYRFTLRVEVENHSDRTVRPEFGVRWPAHAREGSDFEAQALVAMSAGDLEQTPISAVGLPGIFDRIRGTPAKDMIEYAGDVSWAGVQDRYFLSVLLPNRSVDARARFLTLEPGVAGAAELSFPPVDLPPGQTLAREFRVYAGPKEAPLLVAMGSQLDRSLYIGWAWVKPFADFFGWLLRLCYAAVPNYGVSIILLTFLVRVVTAPLTVKQMKSMEGMRKLQPKIKELQARHGEDRQKQSEEMMKLYRSEGVNPLGGCLPMVLQLPVFIGLYYALQGSIELRQQPFMLWIQDLSVPESLFTIPGLDLPVRVLPVVMGASMILQQRLTPTTVDPAQARMMMTIMPIMFTVLFYQFPSGLVLYWMVSNFLAMGHQLWIRHRAEKSAA